MISIENLSKSYDQVLAVDKLSLEIPEGQIMGLLGPNGAGKSTTLRILTGFLQPTDGTILVDGHDVRTATEQAKSVIGYLPESSPLYSDMLVFDYLNYIAGMRGLDKEAKNERVKKLSKLCGITDVMHKEISSLSKGYRQRVGLALAMMSDPKILVLDEPTSGLDPNQIREIRSIIKEIGKEKTVIFSTHILSEAEATCDRVVIINKGRIAADGTMAELREKGSGVGKVQLLLQKAQSDDVRKVLSAITGVQNVEIEEERDSLSVSLTASRDVRSDIYLSVKKTDWILLTLNQEQQSLENVFKELTQGGIPDEV
ncbi:ABC transporter ATP-binding protein [Spirochaeta cellobiosiphila]|uniref:ABC transporter ATP-binding protein n=1 Tax=Spirochaeta cellobiosiphila TaxID=504483 RepID=UPI0003FFC961|nr:ATP-binding cassette domain-containing protein [Spirochaeta cellobiosiphila]